MRPPHKDPDRYIYVDPIDFHRMYDLGYTVCREVFPTNRLRQTRYSAKVRDVRDYYRRQGKEK